MGAQSVPGTAAIRTMRDYSGTSVHRGPHVGLAHDIGPRMHEVTSSQRLGGPIPHARADNRCGLFRIRMLNLRLVLRTKSVLLLLRELGYISDQMPSMSA